MRGGEGVGGQDLNCAWCCPDICAIRGSAMKLVMFGCGDGICSGCVPKYGAGWGGEY